VLFLQDGPLSEEYESKIFDKPATETTLYKKDVTLNNETITVYVSHWN